MSAEIIDLAKEKENREYNSLGMFTSFGVESEELLFIGNNDNETYQRRIIASNIVKDQIHTLTSNLCKEWGFGEYNSQLLDILMEDDFHELTDDLLEKSSHIDGEEWFLREMMLAKMNEVSISEKVNRIVGENIFFTFDL